MRILITNDDGVEAPGIWALYREVSCFAEALVVAPITERSATGHAISVYNEISARRHIREEKAWGYGIDGTPADCVKMALTTLMKDSPPDLVISGINRGQNTGTSILYSGTVAAALEATMYGFPSIAMSLAVSFGRPQDPHAGDPLYMRKLGRSVDDYAEAARLAVRLARAVHTRGLPKGVLLNVNVPAVDPGALEGIVISKMGHSVFVDEFHKVNEAGGVVAYKNVGDRLVYSPEGEDWDDLVLKQNKVSVTPLHYDMTHHHFVEELKRWMEEDDSEGRAAGDAVASTLGEDLDAEVR